MTIRWTGLVPWEFESPFPGSLTSTFLVRLWSPMLTPEGTCRSYPDYRGTSPIRNSAPLSPYSRTMPRALRWSGGGGRVLMSEVPLYAQSYMYMYCRVLGGGIIP